MGNLRFNYELLVQNINVNWLSLQNHRAKTEKYL